MSQTGLDIAFCWDFADCSPADGLRRLKGFGFEGVELWPGWIEKFGLAAWDEALRETGMQCFQLCPYFDFVHGSEELAQSRLELERFLGYAREIGCARLRAFTGPVSPSHSVGARQASPVQWQSAISGLREFCDHAAKYDVELCLECHEGMLTEDSAGALRLLAGVDRPNLTTNLQIPLVGEVWQATVEALGSCTTHIHMHNWQGARVMANLTYLSEGDFDWLPLLRLLVHHYRRRVCLSVEHPTHTGRHKSWETARRDGPYLQALKRRVMENE